MKWRQAEKGERDNKTEIPLCPTKKDEKRAYSRKTVRND
jgi:hypothetical protein